jgi:ABC-type amino acid transport substrate-binding protein
MLKHLILLTAFTCALISAHAASNPIEVKVGGYLFPPFVQMQGQDISGLTLDLIDLLNEQQNQFKFSFIPTSPKRRYRDFKRGMYDAIFFENTQWGWQDFQLEASQVFLSGGEAFFAHKKINRTQGYFDHLKDKRIVAILGYHYRFLDNETDSKVLKKRFNIKLVNAPNTVLNQVINDKADIGIATYAYLQEQIKRKPSLADELLIKNAFDQTYEHRILVRHGHPLTASKINKLLDQLHNNGSLDTLLAKYGLSPLP